MEKTEEYKFIQNIGVSEEMISELGKFSILWAQFELEFCNNDCIDKLFFNNEVFNNFISRCGNGDKKEQYISARNNFRNYCGFTIDYSLICQNLINALLNYLHTTKETITTGLIHEKLYSNTFTSYYSQVDNIICNHNINNEDLLLGCLLIIFRLRNNLFHGLKDCYTINKQLELFKSCNSFLNFLLTH